MNFTKTIQVSGTVEVLTIPVSINFSYTDAPTYCNFNFNKDGINVYGGTTLDGTLNYNVSNGSIDKSTVEAVKDKCIELMTNYTTL